MFGYFLYNTVTMNMNMSLLFKDIIIDLDKAQYYQIMSIIFTVSGLIIMVIMLLFMKKAFNLFEKEEDEEEDSRLSKKLVGNINDDNYEYASLDTN